MSDSARRSLSPVKRALIEIRELRRRLARLEGREGEPVAIIGLGLRFPGGAEDAPTYWRLLEEGRDAIAPVPADRWDVDRFYDEDPDTPGKTQMRCGGFLDAVDLFDAPFFGISPREAETMDPQQRLLLEVTWEALEHSGHAPDRLGGTSTGVFVGISNGDYDRKLFAHAEQIDPYFATGTTFSVAAGRIAYLLDLRGPAVAVDTACSSSLTAIHQAVGSLRRGESNMALAGGVNVMLSPEASINFTKSRMLAPDGRCKTFDAAADGYVRGEGCGMVVLKRLSDALADGDRVLAVIRGSAVNQDGRSGGLTAPNGPSQEAVIRAALADAGLSAGAIDYVEAHGTGTSLGDSIEAHALGAVFAASHAARPLWLGSVKTNFGHLEAAAGVAGLIKVVLALEHERLPPHLHLRQPNPGIPWDELKLDVPSAGRDWSAPADRPRLAGVSSFGFSGTNAHVIVEQAPPPAAQEAAEAAEVRMAVPSRTWHVLPLSAKTPQALTELTRRFASQLDEAPHARIEDLCFTAAVGRAQHEHRRVLIGGTIAEMRHGLLGTDSREPSATSLSAAVAGPGATPVAFLFTGEGAGYTGMGKTLYLCEPAFGEALDRCDALLEPQLNRSIRALLFGEAGHVEPLDSSAWIQPALFSLEYALAQLWLAWGVKPTAVLGRGLGEVVAACVAGVFPLEEALRLVAVRGRESVAELTEEAGRLTFAAPRFDLVSSVTGEVADARQLARADYWVEQLHAPERLDAALRTLAGRGCGVWIEVGPEPVLLPAAREALDDAGLVAVPSMRRDGDEPREMIHAFATAWAHGARVDWAAFDGRPDPHRVALPSYPFERRRHWFEAQAAPDSEVPDASRRWRQLVAEADRRSGEAPLELRPESFPGKWEWLQRLTVAFQTRALVDMGCFSRAGEMLDAREILERCGIAGTYRELMGRWLKTLADAGVLVREGERFRCDAPLAAPPLDPLIAGAREAFSDYRELLSYVERSGDHLADVLQGRMSALETLFPGGSFELAEGIYQSSAPARYFNAIVSSALGAFVRATPSSERLRVVEIGAGTGGTTSVVLPMLPPDRSEYWFTDLSDLFFERARSKFAEHPFLRFGKLDISKSAESQGLGRHAFHVAIAANVIHATPDLRQALAQVRELLAPGGVLLLFETTRHPDYFDISTGLIEGWQAFEDGLRVDHPLLAAEQWLDLLRECGFEASAAFPGRERETSVLGNHIIAALAPPDAQGTASPVAVGQTGQPVEVAALAASAATSAATSADDEPTLAEQLGAATPSEHREIVLTFVTETIRKVLRLPPDQPPSRSARLLDLGLDSLMAVELRDRLARGLGFEAELPATLVFDHPSAEAIADHLEPRLPGAARPASARPRVVEVTTSGSHAEIESMSDEDVEKLLLAKLEHRREVS